MFIYVRSTLRHETRSTCRNFSHFVAKSIEGGGLGGCSLNSCGGHRLAQGGTNLGTWNMLQLSETVTQDEVLELKRVVTMVFKRLYNLLTHPFNLMTQKKQDSSCNQELSRSQLDLSSGAFTCDFANSMTL